MTSVLSFDPKLLWLFHVGLVLVVLSNLLLNALEAKHPLVAVPLFQWYWGVAVPVITLIAFNKSLPASVEQRKAANALAVLAFCTSVSRPVVRWLAERRLRALSRGNDDRPGND